MEEFALIKSRVNLNRVNLGIALISDLKVVSNWQLFSHVKLWYKHAYGRAGIVYTLKKRKYKKKIIKNKNTTTENYLSRT